MVSSAPAVDLNNQYILGVVVLLWCINDMSMIGMNPPLLVSTLGTVTQTGTRFFTMMSRSRDRPVFCTFLGVSRPSPASTLASESTRMTACIKTAPGQVYHFSQHPTQLVVIHNLLLEFNEKGFILNKISYLWSEKVHFFDFFQNRQLWILPITTLTSLKWTTVINLCGRKNTVQR